VRATWEPDPLGQPGSFADLCEAQWHVQEVNDLIQVESVTLLDVTSACPPTPMTGEEEEPVEPSESYPSRSRSPITFYPDGSSDSAEIVLASRSPDLEQRMAVRLIGLTGSISHHRLASAIVDDGLGSEADPLGRPLQATFESLNVDPEPEQDLTPRPLSTLPPASSFRATPEGVRAPVGETNRVETSE
jgi:hypothetical protein